jgi:hypothetical protein
MGDDLLDAVRVILDGEVKAPVFIHTGLPNVSWLSSYFRVQRWIGEILHEKGNLLEKCRLANRRAHSLRLHPVRACYKRPS